MNNQPQDIEITIKVYDIEKAIYNESILETRCKDSLKSLLPYTKITSSSKVIWNNNE